MPVDDCQPIGDDIATHAADSLSVEALLIEVPPVMRRHIEEIIKPETQHLAQLKRALTACLKGR